MKKALFLFLVIPLIACASSKTSESSQSINSHSESGDSYSISFSHIYVDGSSPNKYKANTIEVSLGDDITSNMGWSTYIGTSPYLLGIRTTKEGPLVKASQLKSYDGSYSSLYMFWCAKENEDNYLSNYYGTYQNYHGDELVINSEGFSWEYSVAEDYKVNFSCSNFEMTRNLSPCFSSLFINNVEIELNGPLCFSISSFYVEYSDIEGEPLIYPNILYNAICFDTILLQGYLNDYLESIDSPYRIDDNPSYSPMEECIYFANNDVTIDYDL